MITTIQPANPAAVCLIIMMLIISIMIPIILIAVIVISRDVQASIFTITALNPNLFSMGRHSLLRSRA